MKPIDIAMIQARRKKIDAAADAENQRFQSYLAEYQSELDGLKTRHEAQLAEHHRRLEALTDEQDELEIAEKVFTRLSGETAPGEDGSRGKPAGIPPMTEMIKEALGHYAELGHPRQRPATILSYIRGKWWPDADNTDVGPITWRMWQRDQLTKYTDGTYAMLEPEPEPEPEAEPEPEEEPELDIDEIVADVEDDEADAA
jgi:hypothetical protein